MKKFLSMALIGCAVVAQAALPNNGGYTISDVSLVSQLPWNSRVVVNFTVTPPAGAPADGILRLALVASNGVDAVYVSDASVFGGNYCGASGRQTFMWDPTYDHKGVLFSDLTFHIAVAETNVVAPYLSVRLADGHIAYHGMAITNKITNERFLTDYMVFRRIPATTSDEWKALSGGKETFTFGGVSNDCAVLYKNASDFIKEQSREVKLTHDFYMAVYPVTWGQYECLGFTRTGGKNSAGTWLSTYTLGYNAAATHLSYDFLRGADKTTQYNFPATTAVASDSLVGKIRARTGLNFDLPTEAQWEYACRAGSTNAYWFTETDTMPTAESLTSHVGSYIVTARPPNAWGLYGMVGCCHQWTTTLGRTTDNANLNAWNNHNLVVFENGAVDPLGPVPSYNTPYRVVRGSHYATNGTDTQQMWDGVQRVVRFRVYRVAYRYPQKTDGSSSSGDYCYCGARLCLTLP
jgi:formylglycine-generating enzyme required for sulfatase activity